VTKLIILALYLSLCNNLDSYVRVRTLVVTSTEKRYYAVTP